MLVFGLIVLALSYYLRCYAVRLLLDYFPEEATQPGLQEALEVSATGRGE